MLLLMVVVVVVGVPRLVVGIALLLSQAPWHAGVVF